MNSKTCLERQRAKNGAQEVELLSSKESSPTTSLAVLGGRVLQQDSKTFQSLLTAYLKKPSRTRHFRYK